jgi:pimeloyl-ACP methyl ester carboxylesterase
LSALLQHSTVVSADGTTIAYREIGDGPGVVLIHGAMQAAQNLSRLAQALSTSFRVYVPDRRGRGRSGPFGPEYGLATEAADLEALLRKTGSRFVFGLSAGALIALYSARRLSAIEKLAVYEPPLTIEDARPADWATRCEREIDQGDLASAMVTIIKGTGDVSPITYVPRLCLTPLVRLAIRANARSGGSDAIPIRALIPTVRYDIRLQRETEPLVPTFADIRCDVLLLGGSRSHRALRTALDALARLLPGAKRVRLHGIGHLAADNTGRPEEVANHLRTFFGT